MTEAASPRSPPWRGPSASLRRHALAVHRPLPPPSRGITRRRLGPPTHSGQGGRRAMTSACRPTQQRAGIGAGACHCCSSRGAAAWTCALAARPRAGAQELAAGALARVKAGVVCCPGCRPLIGHSSGGCCGTGGAASTGKAPVCRRSARKGFPSVRSIRLAWWSTCPRCALTDDSSPPCWSVRRIPTHGRLTPCGN